MELRQATKYNVKIVDMGSNNGQFQKNDATIVMNDINVNPFLTMKMMLSNSRFAS